MIRIALTKQWVVDCETRIRIRVNAELVWAVMEDFAGFVTADPYHTRVTNIDRRRLQGLPKRGARIRIGHGLGLTWFEREGVVIQSEPGKGYAFTDLSRRGRALGFPHLYEYSLEPIDESHSEVRLSVRGAWTAKVLPRWLVYAWLWWVLFQAKLMMKAHLTNELQHQRSKRTPGLTTRLEERTVYDG